MTQWLAAVLDAIRGVIQAIQWARKKQKEEQLANELKKRDDETTTAILRDELE